MSFSHKLVTLKTKLAGHVIYPEDSRTPPTAVCDIRTKANFSKDLVQFQGMDGLEPSLPEVQPHPSEAAAQPRWTQSSLQETSREFQDSASSPAPWTWRAVPTSSPTTSTPSVHKSIKTERTQGRRQNPELVK